MEEEEEEEDGRLYMDGFGRLFFLFFPCEIYAPLSQVDGQVNRGREALWRINVKGETRLDNAIIKGRDCNKGD